MDLIRIGNGGGCSGSVWMAFQELAGSHGCGGSAHGAVGTPEGTFPACVVASPEVASVQVSGMGHGATHSPSWQPVELEQVPGAVAKGGTIWASPLGEGAGAQKGGDKKTNCTDLLFSSSSLNHFIVITVRTEGLGNYSVVLWV